MGKKNNKTSAEELTVVSQEPVDSIEETKLAKDSKLEEPKSDLESKSKDSDDKAVENSTEKTESDKKSDEKDNATGVHVAEKDDKKDTSGVKGATTDVSGSTGKEDSVSTKKGDDSEKSDKNEEIVGNEESGAPPPPPRPVSPASMIKKDLKDAFPNIEDKLITAVLIASQGNVDPAFNALLYISDPSFQPEIPTPVTTQPQTKSGNVKKGTLTDDELLARKLQQEFELKDRRRRSRHEEKQRRRRGGGDRQHPQLNDYDDDSTDEFGQIKESFTQGFEEARTTLNGWVSGIAKKFQEPADGDIHQSQKQSQSAGSANTKLFGALGGSSFNFNNNNKQKTNSRFDEDPQIISNNFHEQINLNDHDVDDAPSLPKRQGQGAPNSQQKSQQSDTYSESNKKWQPLNSDVPVNSDAFLVTDSEDEDTGVANYNTSKTDSK